jgi:hypothetical protein
MSNKMAVIKIPSSLLPIGSILSGRGGKMAADLKALLLGLRTPPGR